MAKRKACLEVSEPSTPTTTGRWFRGRGEPGIRAKTVDGKRSGLGEVRDRHDESDFGMTDIELMIGQSSTEAERKRAARLENIVYDALKVSTSTAIAKFAPDITDFRTLYKQEEAKHLQEPVLFEGAKDVLAKIVAEGGRNFLVSHRNHLVLDILDRAEIAHYFTEVVTSENGFARKPSPDSFLYLIKKYDIKHGLVIGDRQIDIEAGEVAGLDTLLVDGHKSLLEIVT